MDLEDFRREYLMDGLRRNMLCDSPFDQFERWMRQAIKSQIPDPTAMTLATVDSDGQPSQRIVLLKHFDEKGYVFYTNFGSAKAKDIAGNPKVSLHFPWHMLERQVKIIGSARKLDAASSLKYFLSRPRDSQLAALASKQSRKISSRRFLHAQFEAMKHKYAHGDIPLPDFWGGYIVDALRFEFWQGGENRLHDRFQYRRDDEGIWVIERLAP